MGGFWRCDTHNEQRGYDTQAEADVEAIRLRPALSVVWFQSGRAAA